MLYVGLDLSRKRLDWHALAADGERLGEGACPPESGRAPAPDEARRVQKSVRSVLPPAVG
jgi:hypothetical protein